MGLNLVVKRSNGNGGVFVVADDLVAEMSAVLDAQRLDTRGRGVRAAALSKSSSALLSGTVTSFKFAKFFRQIGTHQHLNKT